MYNNTEAKLSRTVSISNDAYEAVRTMAKAWETDTDHAADRMLIVSLGRLQALAKYNKEQKKEARAKAKPKAAKKPRAPKKAKPAKPAETASGATA